jgi:hypothetical protein
VDVHRTGSNPSARRNRREYLCAVGAADSGVISAQALESSLLAECESAARRRVSAAHRTNLRAVHAQVGALRARLFGGREDLVATSNSKGGHSGRSPLRAGQVGARVSTMRCPSVVCGFRHPKRKRNRRLATAEAAGGFHRIARHARTFLPVCIRRLSHTSGIHASVFISPLFTVHG